MFKCYFCEEKSRVSYFSNWCEDCANLRRMLLIYSPEKCCGILKRTLTRDEKQIDYKVAQEVKKIVVKKIQEDSTEDDTYEKKPATRSSSKAKSI